jgi:ectoine hydroxylase-related dioxygenase (phytanoyl-CoA dioxygenase family)
MNRLPLREITEEEVRTFWKDGVVCLRDVIDMEWIERTRVAFDRILEAPGPTDEILNPNGTPGRFAVGTFMWLQNDDFRALAFDSPLAPIAARVLRSEYVNFMFDFYFDKEPHTPYRTLWHQDQPGHPVDGDKLCGTWLPLDHVTAESGALEVIAGSHAWDRWFVTPLEEDDGLGNYAASYSPVQGNRSDPVEGRLESRFEPRPDFESQRDKYEILSFDTEPGDLLVVHTRSVHTARGNDSDRRRRAMGHRWVGDDTTYAVREGMFGVTLPRDPGIDHGEPFPAEHDLFPRLWPRADG